MTLVLEEIAFNHDPAAVNHDAVNIRRSASATVQIPEWRRGLSTRPEDSPAAYSINDVAGNAITIKARVHSSDPKLKTVEVRGVDPSEDEGCCPGCTNVLGTVAPRTIELRRGRSGLDEFVLQGVRLVDCGVGIRTVTWRWEYRLASGDSWRPFALTHHRIYSLISVPRKPWVQEPFGPGNTSVPWTDVLDYACWWASGARTEDHAARMITAAVYDLGPAVVTYDCPGGGSTHYALPVFNCTAFIDRLRGGVGLGQYVNCTDCATISSTFANALGCDLWQSRMGYFFELNELLAIGSNAWQTACGWGSFSYHEVAWEDDCTADDDVFDACLQVDADADPTSAPHTPLLPTDIRFGLSGQLTYRDRLASPAGRPNCNPQPATRTRRAII